jgi:hypothetical protein
MFVLCFLHLTFEKIYNIHHTCLSHTRSPHSFFSCSHEFLLSVQLFLFLVCAQCWKHCPTHTAAEPNDVSSFELLHPQEIFRRQKRNNGCCYCIVNVELSWTFALSVKKKVKQYYKENSCVWCASSLTRVCAFLCVNVWPAKFLSGRL